MKKEDVLEIINSEPNYPELDGQRAVAEAILGKTTDREWSLLCAGLRTGCAETIQCIADRVEKAYDAEDESVS